MTYIRVIPRDLFNEADLLKCLGKLWINLESAGFSNHDARLAFDPGNDGQPFDIRLDESDGSISVRNVALSIGGEEWHLSRPLNSRAAWPLLCQDSEGELDAIRVFTDEGSLSDEFSALVRGES
jgi:hypothetical protein